MQIESGLISITAFGIGGSKSTLITINMITNSYFFLPEFVVNLYGMTSPDTTDITTYILHKLPNKCIRQLHTNQGIALCYSAAA